jgi:hypothetical protein
MAGFIDLPREILHHILADVGPEDLAAVSSTCRELRAYIHDDLLLWKLVYLSQFVSHPRWSTGEWRSTSSSGTLAGS